MSDLQARFDQALADSKLLPAKHDNSTLLQIYSLYKQATEGDVTGKRPSFTNPVGRAKHDAWAEQQGLSHDEARDEYVVLVRSLRA